MKRPLTPLVWWHIRHVLVLWAIVHIAIAVVMKATESGSGLPPAPLSQYIIGAAAVAGTIFWTSILAMIDRYRLGVATVFGNFGYSGRWLFVTTAVIAVGSDTVVNIVVRTIRVLSRTAM